MTPKPSPFITSMESETQRAQAYGLLRQDQRAAAVLIRELMEQRKITRERTVIIIVAEDEEAKDIYTGVPVLTQALLERFSRTFEERR